MKSGKSIPDEVVSTLIREDLGECLPIDIWYDGDIWVFRPFGRIDAGHSEDLDNALSEGIGQGMRQIALDFTDTSFISSSGLRAVIRAAKEVKSGGGALVLCSLREPVLDVFRMSGLLRVIPCYLTVQEAITRMRDAT